MSQPAQRAAVLRSYRRLYRARSALFQGDGQAMRESRKVVRQQFLQHGTTPIVDAPHFAGLLTMVDEAVDMLRNGIVRGNLNPTTGHYGVCVCCVFVCVMCLEDCIITRVSFLPCERNDFDFI